MENLKKEIIYQLSSGYFHIPIDEYLKISSLTSASQCKGNYREDICCSSVNTGMFDAIVQVGDIAATFVGHDHDNDFGFTYENVDFYYGRKSGYGGKYATPILFEILTKLDQGYGPPLDMQRGSRVVLLKEGVRGVSETWIRNEDGSRQDFKNCAHTGNQAICCGASENLQPEQLDIKTPVNHYGEFKMNFESAYGVDKPNKCQLYEAAFRAGMKRDAVALEHAPIPK